MCSDEDGSKHFLVDFEQKNLAAQAERRRMLQQRTEVAKANQQQQDEKDQEVISEQEEVVPNNPDEQWSVTVTVCAYYAVVTCEIILFQPTVHAQVVNCRTERRFFCLLC